MADSYFVIVVKVEDRDFASVPEFGLSASQRIGPSLCSLITRVDSGCTKGSIGYWAMDAAGTRAEGSIDCTTANAAGNTVTFEFGGESVVLTEAVDFIKGATDTTCALALTNAVNAHPILKAWVTAVANAGTMELTFIVPGQLGHDLDLATDDATAFALTQIGADTAGDPGTSAAAWRGGGR